MSSSIQHPTPDEYPTWAADYVRRVGAGDVLATLAGQSDELNETLRGLSDQEALFRFGPGEWSIKEVVGHLCDFERIIYYRTLCISRGEQATLPGFDQDDYVSGTHFDDYPLLELLEEFRLIRQSNLLSLKHFSAETGLKRGSVSSGEFTVRALVYMLEGHVYHHLEALRTRYAQGLKETK